MGLRGSRTLLALILIGSLIILSPTPLSQIEKPVVVGDPVTFGNIADLQLVKVNDNGTHLIIYFRPNNSSFPVFSGTYMMERNVGVFLDKDANPLTGVSSVCRKLLSGFEGIIAGYKDSTGAKDAQALLFDEDGNLVDQIYNSSFITVNNSGAYITLPISLFNLSIGDTVRVFSVETETSFTDYLPTSTYNNITVNYTAVRVDGSDSEWNFSNSTLALDEGDNYTAPYQGLNLTGVYIASDNRYLYFLFKLDSPFNKTLFESPSDSSRIPLHLIILYLDVDNDGVRDYLVRIWDNGIDVEDLHTYAWSFLSGPLTWNTSNVEVGINLSYIGLSSLVGQKISVRIDSYLVSINDRLTQTNVDYGFVYKIGTGGKYLVAANNYCPCGCPVSAGISSQVFGNLNLTLNLTSDSSVYVLEFNSSPTLKGSYRTWLSDFYKFIVDNESAIVWPIRASIVYNESLLSSLGYSEDELWVFYYNRTADKYEPLPADQVLVNTTSNTVFFNITRPIYEAGDPIIVLGGIPAVGGSLVLYEDENSVVPQSILLVLVVATATVSLVGYNMYRRRK